MPRSGTRTAAMAAVAFLAACAPAMLGTTASHEATIRGHTADFLRGVEARDIDRVMVSFAPDAVAAYPNTPVARGRAAIRQAWADVFALPNLALTIAPATVQVAASGDVATQEGNYTFAFDSPGGRVTDQGTFSSTWRNVNGTWLVTRDQVTSSVPMPEPPVFPVGASPQMSMHPAAGLQWGDLVVPGFAPGVRIAAIEGDPGREGGAYVLRLRFPDGYEFPVHWHPNAENLTVLSGTFRLAMSDTEDRSALRDYGPGDFLYIPGRMAHWGGARGETVIQLHGIGPFAINIGPSPR